MPARVNQTSSGELLGHQSLQYIICIVLFSFIVFCNTALLVYMKQKQNLCHNPARWIQFAVILAATLELTFRIAMKIGHYSDRPTWTDTLWLCYPFFMFYQGIPYGIHMCILLLTIHSVLITRRYDPETSAGDPDSLGFSKGQTKWLLVLTWVGCLFWSAIELYALGDGIGMRHRQNKMACTLRPRTLKVATISYLAIVPCILLMITVATVLLGVGLVRKAQLRTFLSQIVAANAALLLLTIPFLWHHIMGVFYSWVAYKHLWFPFYFMLKSTYLIVPLLWFLRTPGIIVERLRTYSKRYRASRKKKEVKKEDSTLLDTGS